MARLLHRFDFQAFTDALSMYICVRMGCFSFLKQPLWVVLINLSLLARFVFVAEQAEYGLWPERAIVLVTSTHERIRISTILHGKVIQAAFVGH